MSSEPDTFTGRVKKVKEAYGRYLFWSGILVIGGGAWLQQQVGEALGVWRIIWLTLPLVAATIVITWRVLSRSPLTVMFLIGTIVGTMLLSAFVGLASGISVYNAVYRPDYSTACLIYHDCANNSSPDYSPPRAAYEIIKAYLQLYGFVGVVRSVGAGILLGYGSWLMTRRYEKPAPSAEPTA